jgi:hypothetical protein
MMVSHGSILSRPNVIVHGYLRKMMCDGITSRVVAGGVQNRHSIVTENVCFVVPLSVTFVGSGGLVRSYHGIASC